MIRQFAAIALFVYSLLLFSNKKYLQTSICILCAIMLHASALIYLAFYAFFILFEFICHNLSSRNYKITALCLLILLGFTSTFIRERLISILEKIDLYTGYFNSSKDSGIMSGTHFMFGFLPLIVPILAKRPTFLIHDNKKLFALPQEVFEYDLFFWTMWFAGLITILMPVIPNSERMIFMFATFSVIGVPYFSSMIHRRFVKEITLSGVVLLMSLASFYYFVYADSLDILPYHFLLFR
jgi:hypothetical protein